MESSPVVLAWWTGLCIIAAINVCLLFYSYHLLKKKFSILNDDVKQIRKWQFILSSVYVFGCGFRSILPRGDLRRIVLYDSWISCVAIGRTVATIAELSFVAQWSLILYEAGKYTKNTTIQFLAKLPLPLIIIAEISSWYACTTSNYLGTAIEESLWAIAATIAVYGLFLARPYYKGSQKKFLNAGIIMGIFYIIYMLTVDVPTYVRAWIKAEATGKEYLSVIDGFKEVCTHWNFTQTYAAWEYEMVWMSLYFSVAVWMSMYIINAPFLNKKVE